MTREEAFNEIKSWDFLEGKEIEAIQTLIPELAESEEENLKNNSGYYKAGKFWKASTLWNATKDKIPQRVPNRYILQGCTWNIGSLQEFANEVKNVQEVSLDYPIILDMNGNILDGAHRVVKAYLEGKDIDIVYLGDDEWPEPDYDEEKAVKASEDERIRKDIIKTISWIVPDCQYAIVLPREQKNEWLAWLEKQEIFSKGEGIYYYHSDGNYTFLGTAGLGPIEDIKLNGERPKTENKGVALPGACLCVEKQKDLTTENIYKHSRERMSFWNGQQKEQKPADLSEMMVHKEPYIAPVPTPMVADEQKQEWGEEDKKMIDCIINVLASFPITFTSKYNGGTSISYGSFKYQKEMDWLKSLRPSWKPSEEQMETLKRASTNEYLSAKQFDILVSLYEQLMLIYFKL